MTNQNWRVLSIGDLVADLVTTIPSLPVEAGKHQLAHSMDVQPGGAGNFLIAGARLGMQMVALGTLGDDFFGQAVAKRLTSEGVSLVGVEQMPGTTTTTVIVLLDDAGGHVFLGNYGSGPTLVLPDSWCKEISSCQAVFSAGYTLQEERISEACMQSLRLAKTAGVPVFFDPGPEMARCTAEQKETALSLTTVLLLTEDELPILSSGDKSLSAARELLNHGPQVVCLKQGGRGCTIYTRDGEVRHPGYPVQIRDTAAAGDSFDAAFIYAWLRGLSLTDTAAFANAMGAAKVRKAGSGTNVPTAAEVQALLDEFGVQLHV